MKEHGFPQEGAVTYWTCPPFMEAAIFRGWFEAEGLDLLVPESRGLNALLGDALRHCYERRARAGKRFRIDPRKNASDGYVIVAVDSAGQGSGKTNSYTVKGTAVPNYKAFGFSLIDASHEISEDTIRAALEWEAGLIRPPQMGKALVNLVDHLNGLSLRDTGGVYYIPQRGIDLWTRLAGRIDTVGGQIYMIRASIGETEIRAVTDALIEKVNQSVAQINSIVSGEQTGKLPGLRGLKSQAKLAQELLNKISVYEEILGKGFETLRDLVGTAQTSIALRQAVILAEEGRGG